MKGYWPSIIIMIDVHPNLVTTFRSFLYLIPSEKSRVKSQVREIKIVCLAAIYVPFPIEIWCQVLKFDDFLTPPPPYFNSIIRCLTMCLETILEGDVLQANYMGRPQQCVDLDM